MHGKVQREAFYQPRPQRDLRDRSSVVLDGGGVWQWCPGIHGERRLGRERGAVTQRNKTPATPYDKPTKQILECEECNPQKGSSGARAGRGGWGHCPGPRERGRGVGSERAEWGTGEDVGGSVTEGNGEETCGWPLGVWLVSVRRQQYLTEKVLDRIQHPFMIKPSANKE